jgi:hypothetical protein
MFIIEALALLSGLIDLHAGRAVGVGQEAGPSRGSVSRRGNGAELEDEEGDEGDHESGPKGENWMGLT